MSKHNEHALFRGAVAPFAFGALAGIVLWVASSAITGHKEPWDGDFGFYLCYLLVIGFLAGLAVPRYFWACPVGLYVGQALSMLLLLEFGSLAPLGLFFVLPAVCGLSLAGWCIGAGIHYLTALTYKRLAHHSAEGRAS